MPRYRLKASPLANPFKIGRDGNRDAVMAKYRVWLTEKLQAGGTRVLAALDALDADSVLVCWCKEPGRDVPCHGDIIAEVWAERQAVA